MPAADPSVRRALLLDLDGTLVDSGPGIMACAADAFRAIGQPVPPTSVLRSFIGPPLRTSLHNTGVREDQMSAAIAGFRSHFAEASITGSALYPGILGVLETLRASGFTLVVATSKPTQFATLICDHFAIAPLLDGLVGAPPDGVTKPKDAIVAEALASCGQPVTALVVGDRHHDVSAARANGLACLGAGWGYAEPDELEESGVASVVSSVVELPAAIMSFFFG